ncbi:Protein of unknown function [Flavobacterium indicum GPTSA100-9 = DSM 17447]|uniref:Uncharacterized protein n=1 Tax=Flavobacterium indicum (strain DSM 17447 / CIP 109464 / GPTSA100-9) TaxID=1094466 RepID=H8XPH3_FLAIG|nr:hypothetical protein [Flavobacterium indicum]CCG53247.1 Protein of unknown function [Flavobacterium indicum GPTSA100-9 = DSM 17447]
MNIPTYLDFFNLALDSIADKTFAKLTLAKTIGKPELQNIYVRITKIENEFKLSVIFKIYKDGLQEIEKTVELNDLANELIPYMNNPFMSAILFTTEKDVVLKLNKKRVATITEMNPTFKNADPNLF